ncbi:MAG TPA: hypothetical protein ENJ18_02585, partial [Nannocystis exedens]|nr:hypothetical protein [Nannocystis exedens]
WEDIRGQALGYLASDDESLVRPFGKWLDSVEEGQPFFATFLTSATHHPYRLSKRALKIARKEKLPRGSAPERYLRLIEAEDRMLGGLLEELEERGLRDNTYIIVIGDHGEGFGDKGIKQHDNNFYEEGLRVPLVLVGPGIEPYEQPGNVSLIDITPTLLNLLKIPVDQAARDQIEGYDLLSEDFPEGAPRWFSCWFEMRCRGFVIGDRKVVYEPQVDEAWYYDLREDPGENAPLPLSPDLEVYFKTLQKTLKRHRARRWKMLWGEVRMGDWLCKRDDWRCKHPKAKKKKYRLEAKSDADAAEGKTTKKKSTKSRTTKKTKRKGRTMPTLFSKPKKVGKPIGTAEKKSAKKPTKTPPEPAKQGASG